MTNALFSPISASQSLGAANAFCGISSLRDNTLTAHVQGTWSGTLSLQGSLDGVNFVTLSQALTWVNQATGAYSSTITANGIFQASITGIPYLRVTMTAYTSGTASVILQVSDGVALMGLDAPLPSGGNSIGSVTSSPTPASNSSANLAATTNATSVKASSGGLYVLDVFNGTAATIYVKLFNKSSAPTVGTDLPVIVIPVAAGAAFFQEFGAIGRRFTAGIAYSVTGAAADSDATAIAAGAKIGVTYL